MTADTFFKRPTTIVAIFWIRMLPWCIPRAAKVYIIAMLKTHNLLAGRTLLFPMFILAPPRAILATATSD